MVIQEREVGAGKGAGGEVEETNRAAEVWMARVQAVTLRQHHPLARVETRVEDASAAWANGACVPVMADCAEIDIVLQVAGQHPPSD